jgi:hypothetical protein
MSFLLSRIPVPYLILGVAAILVMTHAFSYLKGYKLAETKHKSSLVEQMKKERKYLEKIDSLSRELVSKQNTAEAKDRIVYKTIIKEIPNATSGILCFTDSATGLWNNALIGEMPEASTGAPTETSGTRATDTEILENAAENFHLYKTCRDRLNALIDWHESVEKVEAK